MSRPVSRDYQVVAKVDIKAALKEGFNPVLLYSPTGGGKTTIASDIIHGAVEKDSRVIFIAHLKELIDQAHARLALYGVQAGRIQGRHKSIGHRVNVASVQTLVNLPAMPAADIVFIDEAHRFVLTGGKIIKNTDPDTGETIESRLPTMYRKVYDFYKNSGAVIIGLTATPRRLDNQSLGDVFQKLIIPHLDGEPINPLWLMKNGYLVQPRYFTADEKADFSQVKKSGSDYRPDDVFNALDKRHLYAGVIKSWQRHASGLKTVVFCSTVEHSKKTCQEFIDNGIRAAHLDGSTPAAEREQILRAFANDCLDVLTNVNLFCEGYDLPAIGCVLLNNKTMSESKFLQMIGRGLRAVYAKGYDLNTAAGRLLAIANSDKKNCIVIDHGENIKYHGFATDERNYSLDPIKRKKGVAPVKECFNIVADGFPCGALVPNMARVCSDCGFEFPAQERKETKAKEGETVEVIPEYLKGRNGKGFHHDLTVDQLEEMRGLHGFQLGWIKKQLQDRCEDPETGDLDIHLYKQMLTDYAYMRKFSRGWVYQELKRDGFIS